MAIRTDFSSPTTTIPSQNQALTDQELEDILNDAFGEMEVKETSIQTVPSPVLPPPKQSEQVEVEECLMGLLRDAQEGKISEEQFYEQMQKLAQPDPLKMLQMGVEKYKADPGQFEKTVKQTLIMGKTLLQSPDTQEPIIPLMGLSGGIKFVKIVNSKMDQNDQAQMGQYQQYLMTQQFSEATKIIEDLVKAGKACYVEPELIVNEEQKSQLAVVLKKCGIDEVSLEKAIKHPDILVVSALMEFEILSRDPNLFWQFGMYVKNNGINLYDPSQKEIPIMNFIESLPEEEVKKIKGECAAFLKKRLGL